MRGIIFGKTYDKTLWQFNKLVEGYKQQYGEDIVDRITLNKNEAKVIFTNGDFWKAFVVYSFSQVRGLACNIAYIDTDFEENIVREWIKPAIKLRPFTAYRYF